MQYTVIGIGLSAPLYPLDVNGTNPTGTAYSARFSGNILANSWSSPSDAMFKNNITSIPNASSVIAQLTPHQYFYDTLTYPQMHFSNNNQFGLVAQELIQVLPELVGDAFSAPVHDTLGNLITASFPFKTINYTSIIPILIAGMQEQQALIDSLQSKDSVLLERLNNLEQLVNSCCTFAPGSGSGTERNQIPNAISVELSSVNSIILNQNDPNPFAEQTTISYVIPESVRDAKIIFSDNSGKILKTVVINERGNGTMQVYASNLSAGLYSYSLVADNKLIDTKKMVCNK